MKVTIPTRPPAPPAGAPPDATNGAAWRGSRPSGRWRRLPRLVRWGLPLLAGLLVIVVVARQAAPPAATAVATPSVVSSKLIAHGVVQPVSRARVGSLGGGVLLSLNVSV